MALIPQGPWLRVFTEAEQQSHLPAEWFMWYRDMGCTVTGRAEKTQETGGWEAPGAWLGPSISQ